MAFINWSDDLSVGVTQFDDDHKELMNIANRLHDSISVGAQQSALAQILKELVNYTVIHFDREEKMMQQHGYPQYEKQKTEHEALLTQVKDYSDQVASGKSSISLSLMGFLKEWLVKHIMTSDRDYKEFFNGKGIQ